MTMIGSTDYVYLGELTCGGSLGYDNTNYGSHGLGGLQDDVIIFIEAWVEHGQSVQFDLNVRIHQPTVGFNNNTQAIWEATFFGINLDGTESGDYGDKVLDRSTVFTNTGPNRWMLIQFSNTFGSVEWTWSASDCVFLADPPGHTPYSTVPKLRTRQNSGGGGGWNVGQA